ncbi:unnamed protein product [Clavelina lepadiformis]|uniref:SH3BP4 C-terminal helical domain-containing protein n=1 Tax=Clavelina lepadiformis TaxID=159417 RepID=A0ABP0GAH3_CLALP
MQRESFPCTRAAQLCESSRTFRRFFFNRAEPKEEQRGKAVYRKLKDSGDEASLCGTRKESRKAKHSLKAEQGSGCGTKSVFRKDRHTDVQQRYQEDTASRRRVSFLLSQGKSTSVVLREGIHSSHIGEERCCLGGHYSSTDEAFVHITRYRPVTATSLAKLSSTESGNTAQDIFKVEGIYFPLVPSTVSDITTCKMKSASQKQTKSSWASSPSKATKPPVTSGSLRRSPGSPTFKSGLTSAPATPSHSGYNAQHSKYSMYNKGEGMSQSISSMLVRPQVDGFYENDLGFSTVGQMTKSFSTMDVRQASLSGKPPKSRGSLKNIFRTIRRSSSNQPSSPKRNLSESMNSVIFDEESKESVGPDSARANTYKSFEELTFDEAYQSPRIRNTSTSRDTCMKVRSFYTGDVWRELGHTGGVVQVTGSDVSLHISAAPQFPSQTCACSAGFARGGRERESLRGRRFSITSYSKKRFSQSGNNGRKLDPKLKDYNCSGPDHNICDGRLIIGLVDPPDCLLINNNLVADEETEVKAHLHNGSLAQNFVIAGPSVRVEFADRRLLEQGACLQVSTNVQLKRRTASKLGETESTYDSGQSCTYACLQSSSPFGPFFEVKRCYLYGNTMQVTPDASRVPMADRGNGCQIFVVPVVKLDNYHFTLESLWERISLKSFQVGIYGPMETFTKSTFCVSISSSGFCPPYMKVQHKSLIGLTLCLLNSYNLAVHKVQGFQMLLDIKESTIFSIADHNELADCLFTEEELKNESRVNRIFVLKACDTTGRWQTPKTSKSQRTFVVELKGLIDNQIHRLTCSAADLTSFEASDYPTCLSPVVAKRLAENVEMSVAAQHKLKRKDFAYQWIFAQEEDKGKIFAPREIPGSQRNLLGGRLGYVLKSSNRNKKDPLMMSYFMTYEQGDYLPILSTHTVWWNGPNGRKDYWICYYRHKIGLVQTNQVRLVEYDQYVKWKKTHVTVQKVVEGSVVSVERLKFSTLAVMMRLKTALHNCGQFAVVLRFGQTFALQVIDREPSTVLRDEKITYFFKKFTEYCSSSTSRTNILKEVVRGLLYIEEHNVAIEIITDACFLTTACMIDKDWGKLTGSLGISKVSEEPANGDVVTSPSSAWSSEISAHVRWRSAYDTLCNWQKEKFCNNHKEALSRLHRVVDMMSDPPAGLLESLTGCLLLMYSIDCLTKYDTIL